MRHGGRRRRPRHLRPRRRPIMMITAVMTSPNAWASESRRRDRGSAGGGGLCCGGGVVGGGFSWGGEEGGGDVAEGVVAAGGVEEAALDGVLGGEEDATLGVGEGEATLEAGGALGIRDVLELLEEGGV